MRTSRAVVCVLTGLLADTPGLGCSATSHEATPDASGSDAGNSSETTPDAGGSEAGVRDDGAVESASPTTYPAFTPEMPQVMDQGGPVLPAPELVTVTFAGDPQAATLQAFDDAIGSSGYWTSLAEYGVGPALSVPADHVVVQTALATGIDLDDVDAWVEAQIAEAPGNGWPVPDAQTVYAVYVPPSVTPTSHGVDACIAVGDGYHTELDSPTNPSGVAYALVNEGCYLHDQLPLMTDLMETASHELAEAATDPYPLDVAAYRGFDPDHLAWEEWNRWQDELADACEFFDEGYVQGGPDLPYWLSRVWSNASARAGHDPCVPLPDGVYGNVTPLGLGDITVTAWDGVTTSAGGVEYTQLGTRGWRIPVGGTAQVAVGFYSDGPMESWNVTAVEGDCCATSWTDVLTVIPASFSGKNGDVVDLSITVRDAPSPGTAALLTFRSDAGNGVTHFMPVLVGTY